MIDALVMGKVHSAPVVRQTRHSRDYVSLTLRVPLSGENESTFAHVVAFSESACQALRVLTAGDAVSVAGRLTPGAWTDKEGNARPSVDVVADQVLSVYSIRKKRDAAQGKRADAGQSTESNSTSAAPAGDGFEDSTTSRIGYGGYVSAAFSPSNVQIKNGAGDMEDVRTIHRGDALTCGEVLI